MVDAVGGVARIIGVALKIKEAASTVHQNKEDCHHIKRRVEILDKTLSHHENNTELMEDSAVTAALEALDEVLAEALEVITECQQERCVVCAFYTAGKLSRKLGKVEQRISYLNSDAMLTIMSYQLLSKFHDGAPPHPPTQIYSHAIHTPLQSPTPAQKMSRQNQDEANKLVRPQQIYSRATHTPLQSRTLAQKMTKQNQDEANNRVRPQQMYSPGTHTTLQPLTPAQKMSKLYQDEANKQVQTQKPMSQVPKFGYWDSHHERYLDRRESYRSSSRSCRRNSEPRPVPKFGAWSSPDADNSDHAEGFSVIFNKCRANKPEPMAGPPRSLVQKIVEAARSIREASETVLQNRDDCVEINKRANKVSTLLSLLKDTKVVGEPAMQGALEKLLMTFSRAHALVTSCQRRCLVIACLSSPPGRLSKQLHEVLDQMVSNIDDMTDIILKYTNVPETSEVNPKV